MKIKKILAYNLVALLAACGGGGGGNDVQSSAPVTFNQNLSAYPVGSFVVLDLNGPEVSEGVAATLDGEPLQLAEAPENLAFVLPDVAPGTHLLKIVVGGAGYELQIKTIASVDFEDPLSYINDALDKAQSQIAEQQAVASGDELAFLQELASMLADQKALASSQTEEQLQEAARILAANGLNDIDAQLAGVTTAVDAPLAFAGFEDPKLSECRTNARNLVAFGAFTFVAAAGAGVSGKLASISPWLGATVMGVSGIALWEGLKMIKSELKLAYSNCIDSISVNIAFGDSGSGGSGIASAIIVNQDTLSFDDGIKRAALLRVQGSFSDVVADSVFAKIRRLGETISAFRMKVASLINIPAIESPLLAFAREKPAVIDARDYSVIQISDERIHGEVDSDVGVLGLSFGFAEGQIPANPVSFTFYLKEAGSNELAGPFSARLTPMQCVHEKNEYTNSTLGILYAYVCQSAAQSSGQSTKIQETFWIDSTDPAHYAYSYDEATTSGDAAVLQQSGYSEEGDGSGIVSATSLVSPYFPQLHDPGLSPALPANTVLTDQIIYHYYPADGRKESERNTTRLIGNSSDGLLTVTDTIDCGWSDGSGSVAIYHGYSDGTWGTSEFPPVSSTYCFEPADMQPLFYRDKLLSQPYQDYLQDQP